MIDLGAVCARDALTRENLANTSDDLRQSRCILDCNGNRRIVHEKEPVSAPGDVTRHSVLPVLACADVFLSEEVLDKLADIFERGGYDLNTPMKFLKDPM